jgi:lipopolysaccharide biosynthesis regulator YciM
MHWLLVAVGLAVVAAFLAHRLHRRREQARAYLKGVRSMISDDPDAAIEALSDAARLSSPEAVETYLAIPSSEWVRIRQDIEHLEHEDKRRVTGEMPAIKV